MKISLISPGRNVSKRIIKEKDNRSFTAGTLPPL